MLYIYNHIDMAGRNGKWERRVGGELELTAIMKNSLFHASWFGLSSKVFGWTAEGPGFQYSAALLCKFVHLTCV